MMSLMKLLPMPPGEIVGGEVLFNGRDLVTMSARELRRVRGRQIGFIFQDPMTSLNPVFTVGFQITEPLRKHLRMSRAAARRRAVELLELVGIPSAADRLGDYPHQFSGGMRQRVMIAMALACDPKVLIADEPTTALDVTIQAQILELVKKLRARARHGDHLDHARPRRRRRHRRPGRRHVWRPDRRARAASASSTRTRSTPIRGRCWRRCPASTTAAPSGCSSIPGQPPALTEPLTACPFRARCPHAFARCHLENPPLISVGEAHQAACWWDPRHGTGRAHA